MLCPSVRRRTCFHLQLHCLQNMGSVCLQQPFPLFMADIGTVLKVVSVPRESWQNMEELLLEELQVFKVREDERKCVVWPEPFRGCSFHVSPSCPVKVHRFLFANTWVILCQSEAQLHPHSFSSLTGLLSSYQHADLLQAGR